jgi:tRNA threonylcarbamoyladenosine biosynthesis protein TsaB
MDQKYQQILAIETSTNVASIALLRNDTIYEIKSSSEIPASQTLIPEIEALLKKHGTAIHEIDMFAVDVGPGSFTGIRVGLTVVKTLAYFSGKSVTVVPSLDALAFPISKMRSHITALLDARKGEVYAGEFRNDQTFEVISDYKLGTVEDVLRDSEHQFIVGNALAKYAERIKLVVSPSAVFVEEDYWTPSASAIGRLCQEKAYPVYQGEKIFELAPMYIRKPEAEIQWDRKNAIQ